MVPGRLPSVSPWLRDSSRVRMRRAISRPLSSGCDVCYGRLDRPSAEQRPCSRCNPECIPLPGTITQPHGTRLPIATRHERLHFACDPEHLQWLDAVSCPCGCPCQLQWTPTRRPDPALPDFCPTRRPEKGSADGISPALPGSASGQAGQTVSGAARYCSRPRPSSARQRGKAGSRQR